MKNGFVRKSFQTLRDSLLRVLDQGGNYVEENIFEFYPQNRGIREYRKIKYKTHLIVHSCSLESRGGSTDPYIQFPTWHLCLGIPKASQVHHFQDWVHDCPNQTSSSFSYLVHHHPSTIQIGNLGVILGVLYPSPLSRNDHQVLLMSQVGPCCPSSSGLLQCPSN